VLNINFVTVQEALNKSRRTAGAAGFGAVQGANHSRSGATARSCLRRPDLFRASCIT